MKYCKQKVGIFYYTGNFEAAENAFLNEYQK